MDSLRTYLVEVVWKQMGPSLIRGTLAVLVGFVAAHHGALAMFGLTYDPTQNTLVLDLDALGKYLLPLGAGALTAAFAALQHHAVATVTGTPQSGDMRKISPVDPVLTGQRKGDPQ